MLIGAYSLLFNLGNVRILKEMRNNVNRIVNCETANFSKTVNVSVRQVENIKLIINEHRLDSLPENSREIALLRLAHDDVSLKTGIYVNPPLRKSEVNHRLRKLDRIAERIRNGKGDM